MTEKEREKVEDFERVCIHRIKMAKHMLGHEPPDDLKESIIQETYKDIPGSKKARKKLEDVEEKLQIAGTDY